jgi:ribosomal-protein-alanine N-acetyltransferase
MLAQTSSQNFILRSISANDDDLSNYLSWIRNETLNSFIMGASRNMTKENLIEYLIGKNQSKSCILFGIFEKLSGEHIGNIKLEPIIQNSAVLGILIGNPEFRGKGVGYEVISQIVKFSNEVLHLEKLELGVNLSNVAAYNLYTKIGFRDVTIDLSDPDRRSMRLLITEEGSTDHFKGINLNSGAS